METRTSAYLRCLGMLYVRFIAEPDQLWRLLSKYLEVEDCTLRLTSLFLQRCDRR